VSPRHTPPVGDMDLAAARAHNEDMIAGGGAGPSGSDMTSTGMIGGLRDTADTIAPDNRDSPEEDDPEAGEAAGVTTTLGDVVGQGTSDADGSALD